MRTGQAPMRAAKLACVEIDGVAWELYELPERSTDVWRSLKLICRSRRRKANYWERPPQWFTVARYRRFYDSFGREKVGFTFGREKVGFTFGREKGIDISK